jgi:hypothetical protein
VTDVPSSDTLTLDATDISLIALAISVGAFFGQSDGRYG